MSDQAIKIIGISGSPRAASTAYAVEAALSYAKKKYPVQTDFYSLHNKKINFCIHCDYCLRKKGCVHRDDIAELYPRLEQADAWILGTPVYQGQMSGQLKTLLDRLRAPAASNQDIYTNKVGAGIAIGGDRSGGQEPTLQSMIDFFIINKMIPTGGGAFGANLGAAVWSGDKGAEGVKSDAEGIQSVHKIVDRLASIALSIQYRRE
jgi:multimeric flavodoxin WrbA